MLKLAFAGTPSIAAIVLESLLAQKKHVVEFVITQPDRPAGRGRKPRQSPVKELAIKACLPIYQPAHAADLDPENRLADVDLLVVVAFGMLLPGEIIHRPRLGSINIHTSLLPRWRGAAPIQRAILAGDMETGVTVMQIDEGLDTGPILAQARCPILNDDTSDSLQDRLATLGAECLVKTLDELEAGTIRAQPQQDEEASYATKISKPEARLDWSRPASSLARLVRAFNPAPVAYTEFRDQLFRIWEAEAIEDTKTVAEPGTVLACHRAGLDVATGEGVLRITRLQPAGKKPMTVAEFLNGQPDFFPEARHPA